MFSKEEPDLMSSSVQVAVRIRPSEEGGDTSDAGRALVEVVDGQPQIRAGKDYFTFDHVLNVDASQTFVYDTCANNLVDSFFEGFNATILAYGQTGSGKTYTMGSVCDDTVTSNTQGIIPRVIHKICNEISRREGEDSLSTYKLRVQFLEIYGEEIRDLLDRTSTSKVTIRESPSGEVYVTGACEQNVDTVDQMMGALELGTRFRTTSATKMNQTSSRSHAVFTLFLERTLHPPPLANDADTTETTATLPLLETEIRKCKFHFVDLAGSERIKRTGAEGAQLKEGIDINKGLLALGNVISALGDDSRRGRVHVPYRDSKITRILQDSLGGNSKTLMICCISPDEINFNESVNALRYANRARNIKNRPVVNRDPTSALISDLRKQLQTLSIELLESRDKLQEIDAEEFERSFSTRVPTETLLSFAALGGICPGLRDCVQERIPCHVQRSSIDPNEIISFKARIREADEEIRRLAEQCKISRANSSELQDRIILLQSELNFIKLNTIDEIISDDDDDDDSFGKISNPSAEKAGGFLSGIFSWGQSSNDPVIGTVKITNKKKSKEEKKALRDKNKSKVIEEITKYVSEIENLKKLLHDANERRAESLSSEQTQAFSDLTNARSESDNYNSDIRVNLEKEVLLNKRQKIGMAKALQNEMKSHAVLINEKSREIEKLKRDLNKRTAEMKKLSSEKERAEVRARDALREGAMLRKKASDLQRIGSAAQAIAITRARKLALFRAAKQKVTFSEEQLKTKSWLDRRLLVITEKEKRVNTLLEKYEQQLQLLEKKQSLEQERESIEQMEQEAKEDGQVVDDFASAKNAQSLGEINDLMEALDQTISDRVKDIDEMQTDLMDYRDVMDTDLTIQHLLKHATTMSEANEMIRLLFDMLLKARVSVSCGGDILRQNEDKMRNLEADLEEKRAELLEIYQSSEGEIQKLTKSYESKLFKLTESNALSLLLATKVNPMLSEHEISGELKAYQNLANERATLLQAEIDRITNLNTTLKDILYTKEAEISKQSRFIAEKNDHIKFLEEECSVFKEIADDLRNGMIAISGSSAGSQIRKLIPSKARERLHIFDESDDDEVELDSEHNLDTVFEFTSLAEEILKTGDVTIDRPNVNLEASLDRSEKQVFERLTNPSNFTGSQRSVFQQNLLKKRDNSFAKSKQRRSSNSGENMDIQNVTVDGNHSFVQPLSSSKEKESRIYSADYVQIGNMFPSSVASFRTAPQESKEKNVFSRLNNPRRYTGIAKYRSMTETWDDSSAHTKIASTLHSESPVFSGETSNTTNAEASDARAFRSISATEIPNEGVDFSTRQVLQSSNRSLSPSETPIGMYRTSPSLDVTTSKGKEREKFKLQINDKDTSPGGALDEMG